MTIIRGTFRLSIVTALLVAIYYGITGYMAVMEREQANWKLWNTLRCGARFLDQDMSKYTSPVRPEVIDIGRVARMSVFGRRATKFAMRLRALNLNGSPRSLRVSSTNCITRCSLLWGLLCW